MRANRQLLNFLLLVDLRFPQILPFGVHGYFLNLLQLLISDVFIIIIQKQSVVEICAVFEEILLFLFIEQADKFSSCETA